MKILIIFLLSFPAFASHIRTTDLIDVCTSHTVIYRNVPQTLKKRVYKRDGVSGGNHTGICAVTEGCEVDHRVSLELGGSNDISNLMIQPYAGNCNAHQKDALEDRLHSLVCKKEISLNSAQSLIYKDWAAGYKKYVNPLGCE